MTGYHHNRDRTRFVLDTTTDDREEAARTDADYEEFMRRAEDAAEDAYWLAGIRESKRRYLADIEEGKRKDATIERLEAIGDRMADRSQRNRSRMARCTIIAGHDPLHVSANGASI